MSKIIRKSEGSQRALKARATRKGISVFDFTKPELDRNAELPRMQEWLERTGQAKPISSKLTAAQLIRQLRGPR